MSEQEGGYAALNMHRMMVSKIPCLENCNIGSLHSNQRFFVRRLNTNNTVRNIWKPGSVEDKQKMDKDGVLIKHFFLLLFANP